MSDQPNCMRCGARCKVTPKPGSQAKMLRHSCEMKGFCVNCAVHDWLRNTYPANMMLAQSGPKALSHPHIQEQFAAIMRGGFADAMPDEIDWLRIIKNWELPFPTKVKARPENPCRQADLDRFGKEGVPLHMPGWPKTREEQIAEQEELFRGILHKIFPDGDTA